MKIKDLPYKILYEAYVKALALGLDKEFIAILKKNLIERCVKNK